MQQGDDLLERARRRRARTQPTGADDLLTRAKLRREQRKFREEVTREPAQPPATAPKRRRIDPLVYGEASGRNLPSAEEPRVEPLAKPLPTVEVSVPRETDRTKVRAAKRELARRAGANEIGQGFAELLTGDAIGQLHGDEALAEEEARYNPEKVKRARGQVALKLDDAVRRGNAAEVQRLQRIAANIDAFMGDAEKQSRTLGYAHESLESMLGNTRGFENIVRGATELPDALADLGIVDEDGHPLSFTPKFGGKQLAGAMLAEATGIVATSPLFRLGGRAAAAGAEAMAARAGARGMLRAAATARAAARAARAVSTPLETDLAAPATARIRTRAVRGAIEGQLVGAEREAMLAKAEGRDPLEAGATSLAYGALMGPPIEVLGGAAGDVIRAARGKGAPTSRPVFGPAMSGRKIDEITTLNLRERPRTPAIEVELEPRDRPREEPVEAFSALGPGERPPVREALEPHPTFGALAGVAEPKQLQRGPLITPPPVQELTPQEQLDLVRRATERARKVRPRTSEEVLAEMRAREGRTDEPIAVGAAEAETVQVLESTPGGLTATERPPKRGKKGKSRPQAAVVPAGPKEGQSERGLWLTARTSAGKFRQLDQVETEPLIQELARRAELQADYMRRKAPDVSEGAETPATKNEQAIAKLEGILEQRDELDIGEIWARVEEHRQGQGGAVRKQYDVARNEKGELRSNWVTRSTDEALLKELHERATELEAGGPERWWRTDADMGTRFGTISGPTTFGTRARQIRGQLQKIEAELRERGYTGEQVTAELARRMGYPLDDPGVRAAFAAAGIGAAGVSAEQDEKKTGKIGVTAPLLLAAVGALSPLRGQFYSRLRNAIAAAPFEKGTAAQWRAALSKNVAKGEREYTLVEKLLEGAEQAGRSLTRQDLESEYRMGALDIKKSLVEEGQPLWALGGAAAAAQATQPPEEQPDQDAEASAIAKWRAAGLGAIAVGGLLGAWRARRGASRALAGLKKAATPASLAVLGLALEQVADGYPDDHDSKKVARAAYALAAANAIGWAGLTAAGRRLRAPLLRLAQGSPTVEKVAGYISPRLVLSDDVLDALHEFRETKAKGGARKVEIGRLAADMTPEARRYASDILESERFEPTPSGPEVASALELAALVAGYSRERTRSLIAAGVLDPQTTQRIAEGAHAKRLYPIHLAPDPLSLRQPRVGAAHRVPQPELKARVLDQPVYRATEALEAAETEYQAAIASGDATRSQATAIKRQQAQQAVIDATEARDRIRMKLGEVRELDVRAGVSETEAWGKIASAQVLTALRGSDMIHAEWLAAADALRAADQAFQGALDTPTREALEAELKKADTRVNEYTNRLADEYAKRGESPLGAIAYANREKLLDQLGTELRTAEADQKYLRDAIASAGDKNARDAARLAREAALGRLQQLRRALTAEGEGVWAELPDTPAWGQLRGAIVRRALADELAGTPDFAGKWADFVRWWKGVKTRYNLPTHVGNATSNIAMLHVAGLPAPMQAPYLLRAVADYKNYGPATRELTERGITAQMAELAGIAVAGERPTMGELLELKATTRPETQAALDAAGVKSLEERMAGRPLLGTLAKAGSDVAESAPVRGAEWLGEQGAKAYVAEDDLFRVAAYLWRLDKGDTPDVAAEWARAELGDFQRAGRSRLVRLLRHGPFPFITYQLAGVPTFARHVVEHPWRYLTLVSGLILLNELGQWVVGEDLDTADVPERERDTMFGPAVPDLIQVPFAKNVRGGTPALDFTRMMPISGLTTGAPPGSTTGAAGLPSVFAPGGPAIDLVGRAVFNMRDQFTGEKLVDPYDLPEDTRRKIGATAVDFLAPSMFGFHARRLMQDIEQRDAPGVALDVAGYFGLRPRYFYQDQALRRSENEARKARGQARFEARRDLEQSQDTAYTNRVYDRLQKRLERIDKKRSEARRAIP